MIFDAHTHLQNMSKDGLNEILCDGTIGAAVSVSEAAMCKWVLEEKEKYPRLYCCFGVHPWDAGNVNLPQMRPLMEKAHVIGEIGMDSVWCDVDINIQRRIFYQQLELAQKLNKPVVLHTKGCEKEILDMIQSVTVPILVHWYSCETGLDEYIDKGCFFSIGPDIEQNSAVKRVAEKVPLNRLLLETDGIEGLRWAIGESANGLFSMGNFTETYLMKTLESVAELRGLMPERLEEMIWENSIDFFENR